MQKKKHVKNKRICTLQVTFKSKVDWTAAPHPKPSEGKGNIHLLASQRKKTLNTGQAETSGRIKTTRSPEVESQQICFPFVRQQLCYSWFLSLRNKNALPWRQQCPNKSTYESRNKRLEKDFFFFFYQRRSDNFNGFTGFRSLRSESQKSLCTDLLVLTSL